MVEATGLRGAQDQPGLAPAGGLLVGGLARVDPGELLEDLGA